MLHEVISGSAQAQQKREGRPRGKLAKCLAKSKGPAGSVLPAPRSVETVGSALLRTQAPLALSAPFQGTKAAKQEARASADPHRTCQVHFFRGAGMGRFEHHGSDRSRYLRWGQADKERALEYILEQKKIYGDDYSVILAGHSWGSNAALALSRALAREGVKVEAVITLDPVRRFSFIPARTAHRDHYHVNVAQKRNFLDLLSSIPLLGYFLAAIIGGIGLLMGKMDPADWVATVGGQRGRMSSADRNIVRTIDDADHMWFEDFDVARPLLPEHLKDIKLWGKKLPEPAA